jgi:hypothetical protein
MRSTSAANSYLEPHDLRLTQKTSGRGWAMMFSAIMAIVVCIRFFSENLGLVPGVVQYIDVPFTALVLLMALLAFVRRGHGEDALHLRMILYLFVSISLVSLLVNSSRVESLPTTLFLFGFAAPFIFAAAISNVRFSRTNIELVVRTFFWLGVLQLVVGVLYGLPQFLATDNPDYVSGTFGKNAYQFTYFIGLWFLYVLGGVAVGSRPRRRGQNIAIVLAAIAVFGLFYAAQYRAMLIFYTLVILLTLWASPARLSSRLLLTIVISTVSIVALIVIGTAFPNLKLLKVFDLFQDSTPIVQSGKLKVAKNVVDMYADMPQTAFVGSGPATFSSRAYTTFAEQTNPNKDVAGSLAVGLMGGQVYGTDVARRYVGSVRQVAVQGGTTLSTPRSSYISLAAEVGPLGLAVYLAAYIGALIFAYRRLVASAKARDSLGVRLAFTCFGGLVLILIQALFDNWLETTRVSIPLWILVGVLYALKRAELHAPSEIGAVPATEAASVDQGVYW